MSHKIPIYYIGDPYYLLTVVLIGLLFKSLLFQLFGELPQQKNQNTPDRNTKYNPYSINHDREGLYKRQKNYSGRGADHCPKKLLDKVSKVVIE